METTQDCGCGQGVQSGSGEPTPAMPIRIECVRTPEKCRAGNKPGHIYKCGNRRICIADELGLLDGDVIHIQPCEMVHISAIKMKSRERVDGIAMLLDAPQSMMYVISDDPQKA